MDATSHDAKCKPSRGRRRKWSHPRLALTVLVATLGLIVHLASGSSLAEVASANSNARIETRSPQTRGSPSASHLDSRNRGLSSSQSENSILKSTLKSESGSTSDSNSSILISNSAQNATQSIDDESVEHPEADGHQNQAEQPIKLTLLDAIQRKLFRHSSLVSVALCVAYSIVFVVGIVGNSFVVALVLRQPRMRTVTNYFIANLAFADILVLILCMPATLVSNLFIPYVLGLFMCKTVSYLQGVVVSASINTMVVVTVDRFLAICFPMVWHMSRRTARWVIGAIWLLAMIISLPWAIFFKLQPYNLDANLTVQVCAEMWPSERMDTMYFVGAHLIMLYFLPGAIIIFCYVAILCKIRRRNIPGDRPKGLKIDVIMQKSKIKVIKMMMFVILLFLASWSPLYAIFARIKLGGELTIDEENFINFIMPLAQWLGASNSCMNPLLYTFFNKNYKRGILELMSLSFCWTRPARCARPTSSSSDNPSRHNQASGRLPRPQSSTASGLSRRMVTLDSTTTSSQVLGCQSFCTTASTQNGDVMFGVRRFEHDEDDELVNELRETKPSMAGLGRDSSRCFGDKHNHNHDNSRTVSNSHQTTKDSANFRRLEQTHSNNKNKNTKATNLGNKRPRDLSVDTRRLTTTSTSAKVKSKIKLAKASSGRHKRPNTSALSKAEARWACSAAAEQSQAQSSLCYGTTSGAASGSDKPSTGRKLKLKLKPKADANEQGDELFGQPSMSTSDAHDATATTENPPLCRKSGRPLSRSACERSIKSNSTNTTTESTDTTGLSLYTSDSAGAPSRMASCSDGASPSHGHAVRGWRSKLQRLPGSEPEQDAARADDLDDGLNEALGSDTDLDEDPVDGDVVVVDNGCSDTDASAYADDDDDDDDGGDADPGEQDHVGYDTDDEQDDAKLELELDDDDDEDDDNMLFGSACNSPVRKPAPNSLPKRHADLEQDGLSLAATGSSLVSVVIRGISSRSSLCQSMLGKQQPQQALEMETSVGSSPKTGDRPLTAKPTDGLCSIVRGNWLPLKSMASDRLAKQRQRHSLGAASLPGVCAIGSGAGSVDKSPQVEPATVDAITLPRVNGDEAQAEAVQARLSVTIHSKPIVNNQPR